MKMGDAILKIRDAIDERTSVVNKTGPGYGDVALERTFSRAEAIYYRKEIENDSSRFLTPSTLTGTGLELLDLPGGVNFRLTYGLFSDSTRLIQYTEIPYTSAGVVNNSGSYNNVFYFLDSQIGIIPTVASGTTMYFDYYKNYIPMTYSTASDLHEYSLEACILYTAKQALKFRGDGNWKVVAEELKEYEDYMLPKIKRSSLVTTPILPTYSQRRYEIIGIR